MGLDSRNVSPELAGVIACLACEVRSFGRTSVVLKRILAHSVSPSTVRRVAAQIGHELAEVDHWTAEHAVTVPEVAAVSCDGGRIRTREPGQGRGVKPSGENGWRETKNASLERMTLTKNAHGIDPCPTLPTTFRSTARVANITGKPESNVDMPEDTTEGRTAYRGPRRLLRTVVSSMVSSDDFGPMMRREAERRRFFESPRRAFLGDGLAWNWSIQKKHFPTFTPILDFIHPIEYLFSAAMCAASEQSEQWKTYVDYVTRCWEGRVDEVIDALTALCDSRGIHVEDRLDEDDPNKPLTDAVRYLTNHRSRMDYPRYRRLGLPVTSSPMESLIKQINLRVKGTEMFWDDPEGAEAILQLRAAALSDDGRLENYLATRPGHPFVRRTTTMATAS